MRTLLIGIVLVVLAGGCIDGGPVISKSGMGNLEINVSAQDGADTALAEIYLDGIFIGNVTHNMPVLHAKFGQRVVEVKAQGFKPYKKTITILGEPNHQALNVLLEKE